MTGPDNQPTLEHITILTGSSRMSRRDEVRDQTLDHVRACLAKGSDVGAGWAVTLRPTGVDRLWVYDLLHEGHHIVRCFLCDNAGDSDGVWLLASKTGSLPGTRLHAPQQTPWLAAALASGAPMDNPEMFADVLREVGDLERIVAWALLD
ncbi:hypothetical protein [Pleomorphomonas carboxyditropha]|uniref:Uncharacterized protein n=1 Tax=Pleomorphomonas carboxyditropha TaxID=2023338 RepID=A0A2G9WV85_9HYPH|nr:hypothetical protein [Pleomorphomonas carboxyditropha]PIO98625.1 hypothetical protein CJ014_15015 [Pleomorphomonas carboxyditropha]